MSSKPKGNENKTDKHGNTKTNETSEQPTTNSPKLDETKNTVEQTPTDGQPVLPTKPPPPKRLSADDDMDFGDLDDDMKAYVGGGEGESSGVPNQWTQLMEEAQTAAVVEGEEDEDEEEEEGSFEEIEDEDDEIDEHIQLPPSIFDPKDKDSLPIIPLDRKFYLETDSFINLLDPGLANALVQKVEPPEKIYKGLKAIKQDYIKTCSSLGIKPIKKFLDNITSVELDMTDYGLNDRDIIAMCHSLCNNTYIKKLSLRGSACGVDGGQAIAEMIENNYTITDLDISSTEILPAFEDICIAVGMNIVLEILNVSINELGDKEMGYVSSFLKESATIRELDLSRNFIGDLGAFNLGKGIVVNTSLEKLDLCWNRLKGTKKGFPFFDACAKHPILKHVDIWGNSITDTGIRGITRILSMNQQIEYMNISYNRLGDKACGPIGKSLSKNPALINFIAGPNLWREKATIKMLAPLARRIDIPLQKLDFTVVQPVTKHFLKVEKKVHRAKPQLEIVHGESYGLRERPRPVQRQLVIRRAKIICENFGTELEMLIDELRKEPKKMKELEFLKFLKSCNLYKDKVMTESFIENFYIKKTLEIDCEAIIDTYDKIYNPGREKDKEPEIIQEVIAAPAIVPPKKKKSGKSDGKNKNKVKKEKSKSPKKKKK